MAIIIDDFADTKKKIESAPRFNTLATLPLFSYNTIMYLVDHNELVWKLLKYIGPDAWMKPNLTREEKMALIFNGLGNQNDFRVFMDEGQIDVFTAQACVLRVFPAEIFPVNNVFSDVYISFQVLCYYDINHLTNYQTRVDAIIAEITKTFNGTGVNGVGRLVFDRDSFPRCKAAIYAIKPYSGKMIVMAIEYSSEATDSV